MASDALREEKRVAGMIMIHVAGSILPIPYKSRGSDDIWYEQELVKIAIKAARDTGTFEGVLMIAEAWRGMGVGIRPADDPKREEIVVAWACDGSLARRMVMAPIVRENGVPRIGPVEEVDKDNVKCWIEEALV